MKTSRKVIRVIVLAVGIALIVRMVDSLYKSASYIPVFLSGGPSEWQIESYGREKFVRQALEFGMTGTTNPELSRQFGVKRIEPYDPGVLLIFGENRRYETGLYVDPEVQFEGTYGSGVSITPRSGHIGEAELKKRITAGVDLQALGVPPQIPTDDQDDSMPEVEPNRL